MSAALTLPERKVRLLHQQIASLQRWVEDAGGGEEMLEGLCAPYYNLLRSIYREEPFPSPAAGTYRVPRGGALKVAESKRKPRGSK